MKSVFNTLLCGGSFFVGFVAGMVALNAQRAEPSNVGIESVSTEEWAYLKVMRMGAVKWQTMCAYEAGKRGLPIDDVETSCTMKVPPALKATQ